MSSQSGNAPGAGVSAAACPVCNTGSRLDDYSLGGYSIFACPDCGLRFAPDAFDVTVDYDSVYGMEAYETDQILALERSISPKQFAEHPTYAPFFSRVRKDPGNRLLDVGCGVGRFCQAVHSQGWDVTGIDVSDRAIEVGKRFGQFPMHRRTLEEMVERAERFDVVTAFEVMEHLSKPLEFMGLVRQMLRPGGQFFCTVPNGVGDEARNATRQDWLPPIHVCFFTEPALRELAESSGLANAATGTVWTNSAPTNVLRRAKWLGARILGRPNRPLGLWLHARLSG